MRGLLRIVLVLCIGATALTSPAASQIGGIKVPKVPKVPTVPTAPAAPTTQAPAAQPAPADSTPSTAAQPAGAQAGAAAKPTGPGQGAWVNYDFQPGEIPLYVDDFSRDRVGNFPKRLEFISGNMEVAEWNGVRFLRATTRSSFSIILPDTLTDRFTMEFDATGSIANIFTTVTFAPNAPSYAAFRYFNDRLQGGIDGTGPKALAMGKPSAFETPFRFRIMADGKYVKVYIDETRVANIPNADLGRSNKITIEFAGSEEKPAFVGNFNVLAGGRELYDALEENGRVATQGIYFDSGSDKIKPESTPTLVEIAEMLKDHPDLDLLIEGHTDNVGAPASNLALSDRRAAAVRQALVDIYKIDGNRLTTVGFGDTVPAKPNTTPEGRQQNRRVELVKK
ncbi:MAG TPA: OmpA family protein [Gemmatimonadales bacterium]|nr:OmpA family protein [Gemmatimonadales bacterium]